MSKRRVVVTGLGMVGPVGLNVSDSWQAILNGHSGVGLVDLFDTTNFSVKISAAVKNFDPSNVIEHKELKKMDLFIQYGLAAAKEAVEDAHLTNTEIPPHKVGVAVGSGIGGLVLIEKCHDMLLKQGPKRLSPFFIPGSIINMLSGHISIRYNFKGPNISIVTACTTGAHNIGYGARTIAYGDADIMVCGGSEMATCQMGLAGFSSLRALSKRNDEPEKASRPFDKDRDGFVLGDGAGILVLEEYEHAKRRGAKIYAELIGFGMSADAFHMTLPDETSEGASSSMIGALTDAKINADQIDYINAHGTSTKANDAMETQGVKVAFADHAYKLAVSSTKSMTGHLLGAAGAVEAIFTILSLKEQVAPPTINLDNPDEDCDLDYVPHEARQMRIKTALSNSFGFGGTNGSLIFSQI